MTRDESSPPDRLSQDLLAFETVADNPPAALVAGHNDVGSLAFTHGLPDRHKSWHLYSKVLCVASGRPFLGQYPVSQGPVVLWVEEGARWRISQRVRRLRRGLGITDEEAATIPLRFIALRGLKMDRPADLASLRQDLELGPVPALLAIDNLSRIHNRDENRPSEIGPVLDALASIQRDFGCTIDAIHHDRKNFNGAADASSNLRGSTDLDAWWRNLVYVGVRNDGRTEVKPQSKDGVAAMPYLIHLEDQTDGSIRLVWDGIVSDPKHAKVDADVMAAITTLGMKATVNNIAKESGHSKPAVIASLSRQENAGIIAAEDCIVETGQKATRYRPQTGFQAA